VSVTITGRQSGGAGGFFTICTGRPDKLGVEPLAIGTQVQLVDTSGTDMSSGCTFAIDHAAAMTGTVIASGACNDGLAGAGFAMTVSGTVQLKRTCGATTDSVSATLSGTVAVRGQ
jgi:hypothetical protein